MNTPLDARPLITDADIRRGSVLRYFAQSVSTRKIYEIDRVQFNIFKNDPYYVAIQLPWVITGKLESTVVNNNTILGVREQNERIANFYNRTMPGLTRKLKNYLEFTSPTINEPIEAVITPAPPSTSTPLPPTTTTTTTTTVPSEPLPLISLQLAGYFAYGETDIAYVLQALTPTPMSVTIIDTIIAVGYIDTRPSPPPGTRVCSESSGETVSVSGIVMPAGVGVKLVDVPSGDFFTFTTDGYRMRNASGFLGPDHPLTIQIGSGIPTLRPPNVEWEEAGYRWTIDYPLELVGGNESGFPSGDATAFDCAGIGFSG